MGFFSKKFNQKLTDFLRTKDAIHRKADLRLKYLNPGQKFLQAVSRIPFCECGCGGWGFVRRLRTLEQQLNCWKFFQLLFFSYHIQLVTDFPFTSFFSSLCFFFFYAFPFYSLSYPSQGLLGWFGDEWLLAIRMELAGWLTDSIHCSIECW